MYRILKIEMDRKFLQFIAKTQPTRKMSVNDYPSMTTREAIRRRGTIFRGLCLPAYMAYVLVCVWVINGTRGFWPGFWQGFVILSIMNLIDRLLIDDYWVGHTKAWIIPGTEDLRPYITASDKKKKWIMGTVGMAVVAAVLSGVMAIMVRQ